eukprot:9832-Amphidinium_carterae.1
MKTERAPRPFVADWGPIFEKYAKGRKVQTGQGRYAKGILMFPLHALRGDTVVRASVLAILLMFGAH